MEKDDDFQIRATRNGQESPASVSYLDFFFGRNKPSKKCGIPHVDSCELLSKKLVMKNRMSPDSEDLDILTLNAKKWLNFDGLQKVLLRQPSYKVEGKLQ